MTKTKRKIFIIEDDDFLLEMYSTKFGASSDFEVEMAKSGEEALERLRGGFKPEVIMFDIVMPGIDGFEMFARIKEEELASGAICIAISNLGQKEDIERMLKLGADDYIIKAHFTPTEIMNKVNDLISRKKIHPVKSGRNLTG
ncbi:MAG: response regulator [Candidatus Niyogibacteria bacterium]|nr:response regulator [Candidatus Niyogibacteria bacterium]